MSEPEEPTGEHRAAQETDEDERHADTHEQEVDEDEERLGLVVVLVAVLIGVAAIGIIGQISGAGWFGYRQIMYGSSQLYLLNMGEEDLEVVIEGGESVEVESEGARAVDIVGGESTVSVRDADGVTLEERTIWVDDSDALLKLTPDGCLAVSDLGAFYGRGGDDLEIVETLREDDRFFAFGSANIIWPRQDFPKRMPRDKGDALWVELVGCSLFDEPHFLRAYLDVQLGQRLNKVESQKSD